MTIAEFVRPTPEKKMPAALVAAFFLQTAGAVVVRSFRDVAQNSQRYTALQQAADFPSGLPNPLIVDVCQLSAVTGRGRVKRENLHVF